MGTALTICLLTILVSSAWYFVRYSYNDARFTRTSIAVTYGLVYIGRVRHPEGRRRDWPEGLMYVWKNEPGLFWRPSWTTIQHPATSLMGPVLFTHVRIPLWIPLFLIAASTACVWYTDRRAKPWQCAKCRYDLRGLDGGVCPECGHELKPSNAEGVAE